MIGGTVRIKV